MEQTEAEELLARTVSSLRTRIAGALDPRASSTTDQPPEVGTLRLTTGVESQFSGLGLLDVPRVFVNLSLVGFRASLLSCVAYAGMIAMLGDLLVSMRGLSVCYMV